jgi:hypothetical protein
MSYFARLSEDSRPSAIAPKMPIATLSFNASGRRHSLSAWTIGDVSKARQMTNTGVLYRGILRSHFSMGRSYQHFAIDWPLFSGLLSCVLRGEPAMDRRHNGLKITLVLLGLGVVVLTGLSAPKGDMRSSMAHFHYSTATQVEVAVLRTSARISRSFVEFLHNLR